MVFFRYNPLFVMVISQVKLSEPFPPKKSPHLPTVFGGEIPKRFDSTFFQVTVYSHIPFTLW
jgi:hypothetical protein